MLIKNIIFFLVTVFNILNKKCFINGSGDTNSKFSEFQNFTLNNDNVNDLGKLKGQLIYDFAINYKFINDLSIIWCYKQNLNFCNMEQLSKKYYHSKNTLFWKYSEIIEILQTLYKARGIKIKVLPIQEFLIDQNFCSNIINIQNKRDEKNCSKFFNINNNFERKLKSEDLHQLVVLDMSCGQNSFDFLKMASDKGLLNSSYHWLLIKDYHDNNIWLKDKNDNRKSTVEYDGNSLIEFLNKLNININTELILASKTIDKDQKDYYLLFDVWNPGKNFGGKLNITKIGQFSQCNGLQLYDWFKRSTTIIRRMDMKNVPIRSMIVVTNKFSGILENYLRNERDYHLDSMHRFNFALLNHVKDIFNFSFQLTRTNSWGYEKNGSYDGMIGALMRREIDLGGSPVFFLPHRVPLIDYTANTWTSRPCFIFRHPKQSYVLRAIFLQPFSNDIWFLVITCGIIAAVFLWSISRIEMKMHRQNEKNKMNEAAQIYNRASNTKRKTHNSRDIIEYGLSKTAVKCKMNRMNALIDASDRRGILCVFDSILFLIGAICQQAPRYYTLLNSGRCVVITMVIFTFLIDQFYSASIVSTLINERPKTIKTLRNLIDSSLNLIVEDILYNRDFFRRTTDPEAIELYNRKIDPFFKSHNGTNKKFETSSKHNETKWYNPQEGLKLMQKGGYAFHVDVATAYKIIQETFTEQEICELTEIQLFPPMKTATIVQKGSPLRKIITYGLRRIRETGLMERQKQIWHSRRPRCNKKIQPNDLKVGMQTFTSAVFVLIFGLAASIIILFFEVMHDLWEKSKK